MLTERIPDRLSLLAATVAVVFCLAASQTTLAAAEEKPKQLKPKQAARPAQDDQQKEAAPDKEKGEPNAVLGIILVEPRGEDHAMVLRVAKDGPAEKAGLQPGDLIVSVDGQDVATAEAIDKVVGEKKPGQKLRIAVLRQGEKKNLIATLASRKQLLAELRESGEATEEETAQSAKKRERERCPQERRPQSAWLGILLEPSDEQGAQIADVVPDSPAEKAGLQNGDLIRRIAGQGVDSPADAGDAVRNKKPGEKVTIVVRRGDQEKTFTATLASEDDAPRRRMARSPFEGFGGIEGLEDLPKFFERQRGYDRQQERIEHLLKDLREEIDKLRSDVNELKEKGARK
ncbi:MAG: PDZ domain-containing protein [Rhodopirellula sp.]|nr:PDZ domain-containing protein [Rhodopirellula sp.]